MSVVMSGQIELLSIPDLAAELKVPENTIRKWRAVGKGPRARRCGRHIRFAREDVNAWLEKVADESPNGVA